MKKSCIGVLIGLFLFSGLFFAIKASGLASTGGSGGKNSSQGTSKAVRPTGTAVRSLPGGLQSVLSETLGANDPDYRVTRSGGAYRAVNSRNRLSASIGLNGFTVRAGSKVWGLRLTGWGRGYCLKKVEAGRAVSTSNRVKINRGGIVEWWVNGPLGIEQGWTIANRPHEGKTAGELTLVLRQSGNLRAKALSRGKSLCVSSNTRREVLRYAGLSAYDKNGRKLPAHFEVTGNDVRVVVDDTNAVYPVRIDPWVQAAELGASDGADGDDLGFAVAMNADGTTVVAGAPSATVGGNANEGAVYVFKEPASGWASGTQTAKLTASDGVGAAMLGFSVAVSPDGTTIVAGARGARAIQGAVYVFEEPASGWANGTQTAELYVDDLSYFGTSVAISADGETIVAGELGSPYEIGALYVFKKGASGWANAIEAARLTSSDGVPDYSDFGSNVAVTANGQTIVAGDPNAFHGAVYVFNEPDTGWANGMQTAELTASDGADDDWLGSSVAVTADGATVVAGASGTNSMRGAVYIFDRPSQGWADGSQTAKLTASDGAEQDNLGNSVAVSPDGAIVVAGASGASGFQGAVYIFKEQDSRWANGTETAKFQEPLDDSNPPAYASLGNSVALNSTGTTVLAGAPNGAVVSNNMQSAGAVYVFQTGVVNGACGGSNGGIFNYAPTSHLCSAGTPSTVTGTGQWNWTCQGASGGTDASCSANSPESACGSAEGGDFTSAPTSDLCNEATASTVTDDGYGSWVWTCTGAYHTLNVSCFANIELNGACGSANGGNFTSAPTENLCDAGTASTVTGTGPWNWTCQAANGGTDASCSANVDDGACGSANGENFTSAPTNKLCSAGTASAVTDNGSGSWIWTCAGSARTVDCSAHVEVNGVCGSASGGNFTLAPTKDLCSAGTASTVTGTGPWTWTCTGENGGADASCSANVSSTGGLWQNATPTGGGWYYLDPFGAFNTNNSPWIYHQTLGWLYPVGTSTDSIWFYDPQWDGHGGWWWTSGSLFPWIYSATENEWLYYDAADSTPGARWFFTSAGQASTH